MPSGFFFGRHLPATVPCVRLPQRAAIYVGLRFVLRCGVLRWVWHPGLFEIHISLCLVSLLVLYV